MSKEEPRFPSEWIEDGVVVIAAKADPDSKPLLYACPKCGQCHSPAIYACRSEEAHAAAKRAAKDCYNCMTDRECEDCGKSTGAKYRIVCDECHCKRVLSKAQELSVSEIEECFGWSGEFYHSPEEAIEAGESVVFPTTFRTFHLDAERVIEGLLEDHFEDASPDDLNGLDDLIAAINSFNEAQTRGTYDEDRSRYALLPPQADNAAA